LLPNSQIVAALSLCWFSLCLLQPVVPRADESVSQLHSRYTAALLELGKQHNVQLTIVA
jgi:hypothetical protein